jgi:hypothetical protein
VTDYRATFEQWANMADAASDGFDDGYAACLIELCSRVEALEQRCEVQLMQLSELQGRHHRLTLQVGHLEHELVRDDDDEPQQHCLEAMDPSDEAAEILDYYAALSAQHQGGAVFHSNSSSLVERVAATLHAVTDTDPNVPPGEWAPEARAAIREVNAWLRERAGGTRASWLLDNEIEQ